MTVPTLFLRNHQLGSLHLRDLCRGFSLPLLISLLLVSQAISADAYENPPWDALQTHALLLYRQKRYHDALDVAKRALRVSERQLGNDSLQTAQSLRLLGQIYAQLHRFPQALHAHQRALALFERWLGPTHQQIADTLILIAEFYADHGNPTAARPLYEQAKAVQEAVGGPNHPKLAQTLILIARFYAGHGEPAKAEPLYQRALQIQTAVLDPRDPEVARTLIIIADFYRAQGREDDAHPLYESARVIQLRLTGSASSTLSAHASRRSSAREPASRLRAIGQENVGAAQLAIDRAVGADRTAAQSQALAPPASSGANAEQQTRRQFLEKLAASSAECSAVYLSLGANDEGERLFQEALAIYRDLYGHDLSKTREAFLLHVEQLRRSGKSEEARALETRARKLPQVPESAAGASGRGSLKAD